MILEIQSNTKQNCIKNRFNEEIILILYFTLKPLYLFSSGLPQISDMFLIAAALGLPLKERGRIRIPYAYMQWVTIFLVTLVFQALVQSVWWVKTKDNRMLLYAAAHGRPIITTDRAGCRETVEDGKSGVIIPIKDEDALTDALERFLKMSWEQKRDMGLAGRAKIEREFDREIVVEKYLDEIGKVLK